jgi:hypothetical protein
MVLKTVKMTTIIWVSVDTDEHMHSGGVQRCKTVTADGY